MVYLYCRGMLLVHGPFVLLLIDWIENIHFVSIETGALQIISVTLPKLNEFQQIFEKVFGNQLIRELAEHFPPSPYCRGDHIRKT